MYQSRAHSNTNEVLPDLLCYLFILIFRKYLRNIARKQTCNMFLLIHKKKPPLKKKLITLPPP